MREHNLKQISLVKQFLVIGSGTFLNLILGLLGTPVITRLVNPEEYGQFSMFNTYSGILMLLLTLGLDQSLVRNFYKNKELHYQKALLSRCIILPVAASVLVLLFVLLICYFGEKQPNSNDIYIIVLFFTNTVILLFNRFATLTLRLSRNSNLYSAAMVLNKVLYLVIAIAMICRTHNQSHYLRLAFATVMSCALVTIFAILCQSKLWLTPFSAFKSLALEIRYSDLISYGFPLMIANGVYMFFQAIDRVCLEYFCDYAEVGIYSSAMSLMSVIAIIRTTFNTIWTPAVVEHYEKNPSDKTFFVKGNSYITICMFFVGLTIMCGKDLLIMLLGQKYRSAVTIMPFLLFQPIMYTISETTVVGITLMKKPYANIVIAVISCIVNLLGNIILIPLVGAKGAAISTGFSYIVFFAARTFFSNKYYYINFCLKKFALMTVITIVFAFYNTFVPFNIVTVLVYLFAIAALFFLYRRNISSLYNLIKDKICSNTRAVDVH